MKWYIKLSKSTYPYGRWRCRWTRRVLCRWRLRICSSQCRGCRRQRCAVCCRGWTIRCGTFGRPPGLSPPGRALHFCTSGSGLVAGRPTPRTAVWHFHHSRESCCSMISTSGECLYFDKNNNVWITLSLFQYLLIRTCEHMEDKKKKKIYRLFKSLIVSWTWIHLSKEGVSPTPTGDIPVQKRFDCLISRWGFSGRGSLRLWVYPPRENK